MVGGDDTESLDTSHVGVLAECEGSRVDYQRIAVIELLDHDVENLDIIEGCVSQLFERIASDTGIGVMKDAAPLRGGHEVEADESAQGEDAVSHNE